MKKSLVLLIALSFLFACNSKKEETKDVSSSTTSTSTERLSEHLMMATLWQQTAAEYQALCYQAFNAAKLQLDMMYLNIDVEKSAIVVDIDETMLDNSYYEAELVLSKKKYSSDYWNDWCRLEKATAVPGALEFMTYAYEKGFQLFYVSNRKQEVEEETIQNLQDLGFPMADKEHVLIRTDESCKENRRKKIEENYTIIMLIGDNLADFSNNYKELSQEDRAKQVGYDKNAFGTKYIVLPNPMYGDWEAVYYDGDFSISDSLKIEKRMQALQGFE
jgi:5'-nucleotidase (lipoprotein e(P4) family)